MKQILYERGLIDLEREELCTIDGPKDDEGNLLDEKFSFKKLLSACTDFVEEKTMLQNMATRVGRKHNIQIIVDRTPKCHPELAGEGIEYAWAIAKIYLQSVPFSHHLKKQSFINQVKLSLSTKPDE